MAIDAILSEWFVYGGCFRPVAIHATEVAMRADQRETVLLVQFGDLIHQPCLRSMATCAVVAHGHGMHIAMARNAIRGGLHIEADRCVARPAVDARMHPDQRHSGAVMAEAQGGLHRRPTIRKVTSGAIDLEHLTVW